VGKANWELPRSTCGGGEPLSRQGKETMGDFIWGVLDWALNRDEGESRANVMDEGAVKQFLQSKGRTQGANYEVVQREGGHPMTKGQATVRSGPYHPWNV